MLFAKNIITELIEKVKAGEDLKNRILDAYNLAEDKRLVVLDFRVSRQMVWVALSDKKEVLFAAMKSRTSEVWSIVAMRAELGSYKNRKDMPAEWAGLQSKELQAITGVSDAIFCHRNLFLASAESKEGVTALGKLAVKN